MSAEARRDLAIRFSAARRYVAEANELVEAGSLGSRRRWRSSLPGEAIDRLERRARDALAGGDLRAALEAVGRFERAARALRRRGGQP